MQYTLYILRCSDNSLYTGITNNLKKRVDQHNGNYSWGAKYTRGRRPVKVIYQEICEDKSTALQREIRIKKLTKKQKLLLIQNTMKQYRSREEYDKKSIYQTKKNCPFCGKAWWSYHSILFETSYWVIFESLYPYFEGHTHILVVPKKHKEFTKELSKVELANFQEVEIWMNNYFGKKDYFSIIRQSRSNKSVEHLHYHYLEGKPANFKEINGEKYFKIKE